MESEVRKCNACGEEWTDTGDEMCPFCSSGDTEIVNDDGSEQNL